MSFNSLHFLLFFPVVCVLCYLVPARWVRARNAILLVASYYFYMSWQPVYALLLMSSTVITYLCALAIQRTEMQGRRRLFLTLSLVLNLGLLVLFKYYGFLTDTIRQGMEALGIQLHVPVLHVLLPIGISFYTLQALGYTIDVYRRQVGAERNFLTYALFVSFFPQLVAGPIERSKNLLPQLKEEHRFDYEGVMAGLRMMVWGYFLKLVLADRCALYVDTIFDNLPFHNGGSYLVAALLFPLQIYGDFAGYSLIAIGAARVMGFRLMDNFRRPYLSDSLGEFWRRWHISLSTWFRDYLYIPLGGNRVKPLRHYANLLITFAVSGLWHGANLTFLCWGCYHGVLLCVEKACGVGHRSYAGMRRLFHWMLTYMLVSVGLVMFRASSMGEALSVMKDIVLRPAFPYPEYANFFAIGLAMLVWLAKELTDEFGWRWRFAESRHWLLRHVWMVLMLAYILLFGVLGGDQFIYFQF